MIRSTSSSRRCAQADAGTAPEEDLFPFVLYRDSGGGSIAPELRRRAPLRDDDDAFRSLACPLLTLSSACPFSNGIFRSNGAPASLPPASSSLTHARRMDGFCNQNADQLGSLAGPSLLTVYVGVVECAPASLSPASSSLTHARRMDGFCNQNADQLGYLAGPSLLTVYVGVVECAPASLSPASSSLTHARRMDGFCNQNADQLGSLAGPSLLTVYVGVVECAPASLSPRVLLPHTCTQDGWFLQPKRRPARLPRRTVPSNCICRCSRMRARLPLHILLLHTQVSR
jgi:hypothetical protein